MIEEWIEYRKDDPATHPGFEGAYLVTILSKTGARYVEIRPFSFLHFLPGTGRAIACRLGVQFRPLSADVFGEAA